VTREKEEDNAHLAEDGEDVAGRGIPAVNWGHSWM
jgi:hypothetical protein